MARVTVRVPDQMKQEMEAEGDINWSEQIRNSISERLGGSPSRKIQKLVSEYQRDLDRLWILHMFSYSISKRYIYETAEAVFGEDKDDVVDAVESDLEDRGIEGMYDRVENDLRAGDTLRNTIATTAISDIEAQVQSALEDAPTEIRDGVYLLSHYLRNSLHREYATITPDGFERTWELFSDTDVDIDDLVATGLLYKHRVTTNAYNHWSYKVPGYTLELLERVINDETDLNIYTPTPNRADVHSLVSDEHTRQFLRWMGSTTRYVTAYTEQEEIEDELDREGLELTYEEFAESRQELIKQGILYIGYRPHRSNTGNRRSRGAAWRYTLTQPVLDNLPDILLEQGVSTTESS